MTSNESLSSADADVTVNFDGFAIVTFAICKYYDQIKMRIGCIIKSN